MLVKKTMFKVIVDGVNVKASWSGFFDEKPCNLALLRGIYLDIVELQELSDIPPEAEMVIDDLYALVTVVQNAETMGGGPVTVVQNAETMEGPVMVGKCQIGLITYHESYIFVEE